MIDDTKYRKLYLAALSATGFFLPLSIWMLSFCTISLLIIWIAGGGFYKIGQLLNEKKNILVFFIFYSVYVIWMINTEDISFGLKELKIKLPLLIFPLITGLSEPLVKKELKLVLTFFIAGVVISSISGAVMKIRPVLAGVSDSRELSLFISHIRLALMAVLAIFCSGWCFLNSAPKRKWNLLYPVSALWLTVFLFMLLSLTGIIIFSVTLIITAAILIVKSPERLLRYTLAALLIILITCALVFVTGEIRSFYREGDASHQKLELLTLNGNKYQHYTDRKDVENGNKVWLYINEDELRKGWNSKSSIPYDSLDNKGQVLRFTLIRYLTSAGLRKDSAGISNLKKEEIINVEQGITNMLFTEGKPIRSKLYEIIWQIDFYRNGGNPSGNSITQRIEFLKTGWKIFLKAPLKGAGTGDIGNEYDLQYKAENSVLYSEYRILAHNQYLTFLISFGIPGFILICFSLLYPFLKAKGFRSYLPAIFFLILFISMLGEDTLETHTGVSFFAYFYSVFIFGKKDEKTGKNEQ